MKSSTPNILIVQPALPRYRIPFFERLANHYRSTGFRVYFSSRDLGALGASTRPSWAAPLGRIRSLVAGTFWQSGALSVRLNRGDILVVSGEPRFLSTIFLLVKARLKGAHTVWWGHFWSSTTEPWRLWIRLRIIGFSSAALFYTEREVEEYQAVIPDPHRMPIGGLNNGIDINPIQRLRRPYVVAEREFDLVFIGRLTEKAALDLLIRAVANNENRVAVAVVGDGEQKIALQTLSSELGVQSQFVWFGALVEEVEIARVLNSSKIFVYPGAVGLSLIHSMAYGLPSLVHNDRWRQMPEYAAFQEGSTGKSFVARDVTDLSRCISFMLGNPSLLESFSRSASDAVESKFNVDEMSKRFVDFVDRVQCECG